MKLIPRHDFVGERVPVYVSSVVHPLRKCIVHF